MKLSPRLAHLVKQVPLSASVIDVAADHGYVAIELAKMNNNRVVIASDVALGPLTAGKENAQKQHISNIDFRLGDGFSVLAENENVDAAIIAGLGGKLMCNILNRGMLQNIQRLILQANNDVVDVRAFLYQHNYTIIADERVEDGAFIYECLVAEKATTQDHNYSSDAGTRQLEFYFGPAQLTRIDKVMYNKWLERKIAQFTKQIEQMQKSKDQHIEQLIAEYDKLILTAKKRLQ